MKKHILVNWHDKQSKHKAVLEAVMNLWRSCTESERKQIYFEERIYGYISIDGYISGEGGGQFIVPEGEWMGDLNFKNDWDEHCKRIDQKEHEDNSENLTVNELASGLRLYPDSQKLVSESLARMLLKP